MTKIAFVFPGQGCQYVGMGKDLYENFSIAKSVFDEACDILDWDIKKVCFEGPEELLKKTVIQQPAIFTVSIAAFKAFTEYSIPFTVSYNAGLSLGEYSALVASQILEFQDALRLVQKRAELMDESAKKYPGKMIAIIGLDRDTVEQICFVSGKVYIANLNCPGQIVISGEKEGIEKAKEKALKKGAKLTLDLEVSGSFHSPFMQEAAEEFKSILDEKIIFKKPLIPLISNVDAKPAITVEEIKENLVRQLCSPVLWEDSIRFMISKDINRFYEIGPGKVLKGLLKRILPNVEVINIEKKEDILNLETRNQ